VSGIKNLKLNFLKLVKRENERGNVHVKTCAWEHYLYVGLWNYNI